ncbi:MAG: hypothetical protein ACLFV8_11820 [Alphaproteobacteria bacterium]
MTSNNAPFAVIDIGSNSVRMVIYSMKGRFPVPMVNDKVMCGLGRGLTRTGNLHAEGMDRALGALRRFRAVGRAMGVRRTRAVATAAVRDAENGPEFVAEARRVSGFTVEVLSGEAEAALAARGVLFGIPDADGVAGDLGGGSLELVSVEGGAPGRSVTLPVGPLRLMDRFGRKMNKAANYLDRVFEETEWLSENRGEPLYAVGGIWRSFARVVMAEDDYPLTVLHQFHVRTKDIFSYTEFLTRQSPSSLARIPALSSRRADALPYGALILDRLVRRAKLSGLIVSAYGLREGLVMEETGRGGPADPLLDAARDWRDARSRTPQMVDELAEFIRVLPWPDDPSHERLRLASCLFSDIGWQAHPDYRGLDSFNAVLTAPIAGLSHAQRVFLALALWHRYGGGASNVPDRRAVSRLLVEEEREHARQLGLALRLAYRLSGAARGVLPRVHLAPAGGSLILRLPGDLRDFAGEGVDKRLGALAGAMNLSPVVEYG